MAMFFTSPTYSGFQHPTTCPPSVATLGAGGTSVATTISNLGCGMPGVAPQLIGQGRASGPTGSSERSRDRSVLREAFGNNRLFGGWSGAGPVTYGGLSFGNASQTPFRLATNAGDILGTVDEAVQAGLPSVNQVNGIGPSKLNANGGGRSTGGAAYSGNPRYVYDSSNYIRFKRLRAQNQNYNDSTFGGDKYAASQTAISFMRS